MTDCVAATNWVPVFAALPVDGLVVETKIDDGKGVRNVTTLVRKGSLWWVPDGSMYVYYAPTHWRAASDEDTAKVITTLLRELDLTHKANAEAYDAGRDSRDDETRELRAWVAETITRVPPERYTELSPGLRDWWISEGSRRRSV